MNIVSAAVESQCDSRVLRVSNVFVSAAPLNYLYERISVSCTCVNCENLYATVNRFPLFSTISCVAGRVLVSLLPDTRPKTVEGRLATRLGWHSGHSDSTGSSVVVSCFPCQRGTALL